MFESEPEEKGLEPVLDIPSFANELIRRLSNYGKKRGGLRSRKDFTPEQIQAAVDIVTTMLKRRLG